MLAPDAAASAPEQPLQKESQRKGGVTEHTGTILIVEDDPEVRELLELLLRDEGHHVTSAPDAATALELVGHAAVQPDLILADYNLPNGMDGLQATAKLREQLHRQIPVIMLTGDISGGTLRDIAQGDCVHLYKPVKASELTQAIRQLLPISPSVGHAAIAVEPAIGTPMEASRPGSPVIFVVDDDNNVRAGIRSMLKADGKVVEDYASAEAFLASYKPGCDGCLLVDAYLPGMSGLQLLRRVHEHGHQLPAIMITGNSDVTGRRGHEGGASDFIEKPISPGTARHNHLALEHSRDSSKLAAWQDRGRPCRGPHLPPTPDHGTGPRGSPQQEHRCRSWHQPTHGREPSCRDHEANRDAVAARLGPAALPPPTTRRLRTSMINRQ